MEELCGILFYRSAVSELRKSLDVEAETFRIRPFTDSHPSAAVDAACFKVREDRGVISEASPIACRYKQRRKA